MSLYCGRATDDVTIPGGEFDLQLQCITLGSVDPEKIGQELPGLANTMGVAANGTRGVEDRLRSPFAHTPTHVVTE